ncbi:hypothetical protein LSAT2_006952, partial [Lamellibrachia satsuma]
MNSSVGTGANKGPKVHTDIHQSQRPVKSSHRHQPGPIKRTRRKPPAVDDEVTKHLLRADEELRPTIDRCCVIYHGVQTNVTRWRQLGRRLECISSNCCAAPKLLVTLRYRTSIDPSCAVTNQQTATPKKPTDSPAAYCVHND